MGNGSQKDDLIILHKSWIQEWGEIERTFSKKQSEELKAFITRKKDIFRPPYGRSAVEFPRQSIIVGTANGSDFLVDSTGNRRYWIIPVAHSKIDIQRLKQERDRIWSAAVKAYRNGEQWWLTDEEEKLSRANNQQFQIIDEWQSAIASYIEDREQVSITEILTRVFEFEVGKIDRRSQMRVANILTNLSWKKAGQKQHLGKRQVVWRCAIPLLDEKGIEKVLRREASPLGQAGSQTGQGLSIPAIPSVPNSKTTNEQNKKRENDSTHDNSENESKGIAEVAKPDKPKDTENYTSCKKNATPDEKQINWKTYPYNSSDCKTLENRALKVKERVLCCTTSNQLNELLFSRKANELELNWLVENYFTETEIRQLEIIKATTQTNLFSEGQSTAKAETEIEIIEYDFNEIKSAIDKELKRLGWSNERGKQHLISTYNKKSRLSLSDEELLEFWNYLKTQEEGCQ